MNIGEQIIAAIEGTGNDDDLASGGWAGDLHWRKDAAAKLEAVVEAHIEERVKQRIAAFKQGIADGNIDPTLYPTD